MRQLGVDETSFLAAKGAGVARLAGGHKVVRLVPTAEVYDIRRTLTTTVND